MGRLSRYRKTKACDPFNTAPNKLVHLDKAPSKNELDQDVQRAPRAFRHMMSLTKRAERRDAQKKAARQGKATGHPAQGKPGMPAKKSKKKEDATKSGESSQEPEKKKTPAQTYPRMPGESDAHYLSRIDQEAAEKMLKANRALKPIAEKRKKYLTSKKKGKKNITEEGVKEFAKTERVRFGDVVQQPPSLSSKPRKAPEQTSAKLVSSMKLPPGATAGTAAAGGDDDGETSATAAPPKARVDPKQKAGAPSPKSIKCKKSKDMTPHERERLEAVRANAIQLYRQHKKQQLEQRASHR
ncbi:uncharacterized protein LOC135809634 [Sycon ciliatum]|uniref:uncharacterized protein LOC135809634 n=1 Tax=Sycon ciliatum TaxID=27933 RepID=UPI0031F6363A